MSEKGILKSILDVLKYIGGVLGGIAAIILALQALGFFDTPSNPLPEIVSFDATRNNIPSGESTDLTWVVNRAQTVTINGQPVKATGNLFVRPTASTTYILVASNSKGSQTQKQMINVTSLPPPIIKPPQTKTIKGYLIVAKGSKFDGAKDFGSSDTICTNQSGAEFLRSYPPLSKVGTRIILPSEMYQAFQTGICNAIFVPSLNISNKMFPAGLTNLRLITLYSQ